MFMALLLFASTVGTNPAAPSAPDRITIHYESSESGTCGTMRTYVLSKAPDHHVERVLTCVPFGRDHLKRAGTVHLVPVKEESSEKPKLRY